MSKPPASSSPANVFATGTRVWLRGGRLGNVVDGTWCELLDVPDEALGVPPDAVPMALGSAFFSPCTSAWTALHDVAEVQPGERLLVAGASGAVGLIAVQLALELGARVLAAVTNDQVVLLAASSASWSTQRRATRSEGSRSTP